MDANERQLYTLNVANVGDSSIQDAVITNSSHRPLAASANEENGYNTKIKEKDYQNQQRYPYQYHDGPIQAFPPNQCSNKKQTVVFIERDYNVEFATGTQFISEFPNQLTNKVDKEEFENTIAEINIRFQKADFVSLCQRIFIVFDVCTCYIISLICGTAAKHHKKFKRQLAEFIKQENEKYQHLSIRIENPFKYGLRYIVVHYDNSSAPAK